MYLCCKCGGTLWNQPLKITKWAHFKDSKWSLCTKSRLFEGPETFLAQKMARAIARAILRPKKSRAPRKVEILCKGTVLLPKNLHAYFELSAQAWILYKAPQWNARYPNSCPERIKLKMHWGCGPRPLFAGLIQRRWSKPKHGFGDYHNKGKS